MNLEETLDQCRTRWEKDSTALLKGKVIKGIRYLTPEECEECAFYESGPVIEFTDGTFIFPMSDDEGNGPGSLATWDAGIPTIPTIGLR